MGQAHRPRHERASDDTTRTAATWCIRSWPPASRREDCRKAVPIEAQKRRARFRLEAMVMPGTGVRVARSVTAVSSVSPAAIAANW